MTAANISIGVVVVYRPLAKKGRPLRIPQVGKVILVIGDVVTVKPSVGPRKYWNKASQVPAARVARLATEREQVLGYPVDPLPALVVEAGK